MIYPYKCAMCEHKWEVPKFVRHIDMPELCPKCSSQGIRYISRTSFYGAKVEEAEFNHGLGCVTKSADHRKQLAKQRGLEEIGNEPIENIHKHSDNIRAERESRHDAEITDILKHTLA